MAPNVCPCLREILTDFQISFTSFWLGGVMVRTFGLTIKMAWVPLRVGSQSSGYYLGVYGHVDHLGI